MYRAILIILLFLTGCTTSLWAPNYEEEWVNGFYVNQETNELFVTTRDTAYVFPIESKFGEAVLLTRSADFRPMFEDFNVNDKNQVIGIVSLVLIEPNASESLMTKVKALGFKNDELINKPQLSKEIRGKRYTIEGELPLEKLEKEYRIMVEQPRTLTETTGKIVATPATITIDAIVSVPAAFLAATVMAIGSP